MPTKINKFQRYQKKLKLGDLFPQKDKKKCTCGCGKTLTGRKTRWFSKACTKRALLHYWIIKGNTGVIREELFKRDKGICKKCKKRQKASGWFADHILAVCNGGGGCDLSGFQTLCKKCHDRKTKKDITKLKNRKRK